ncbi:MAG: hypothetical protein A2583_05605 [Bdellovibrionales bacterium RIFOXYD1_FULL_53_11]|nr:MAG: hypothetical protein A2583_05605 [Bdellovibrionales bacterium RIFOXYD1_FULL_53_11]
MLLLLPVLPLAYFGITYSFHAYIVIFLYLAACFYCFSRRFKGLAGVLSFNASVSFVIIACVEFAVSGLVFPRPGEMAVVVPEKLPGANEIKSSGIKNTKGIVQNTGTYFEFHRYFKDDWQLGAVPYKSHRVTAKKTIDERVLYDVVYTIDENGLRHTPIPSDKRNLAVLFFGDSMTFGEGVNDNETFPAAFQSLTKKYRAFNFGFHGYGPHQMLRALEIGHERGIIKGYKPAYIIYVTHSDHIDRAAGRASWDIIGPRYEPDGRGYVVYSGRHHSIWWHKIHQRLNRSHFFRWASFRLKNRENKPLPANAGLASVDMDRYAGIIATSDRIVRERYGVKLVVILLELDKILSDDVAAEFKKKNISFVKFSEKIIPGYTLGAPEYSIAVDTHINVLGNRIVAKNILKLINDGIF